MQINNESQFIKKKSNDNESHSSTDKTDSSSSEGQDQNDQQEAEVPNEGAVVIDATCAPADVKYPNDAGLLDHSRRWLEKIIDFLFALFGPLSGMKKPRTYRKAARKMYTSFSKKPSNNKGNKRRQHVKKQLQFCERDARYVKEYLERHPEALNLMLPVMRARWETIQEVLEQQRYMIDNHTHTVADRIVSLAQPWVRPIKRGKAKAPTEFGAKLSLSVVDGYCYVDKLSFDSAPRLGKKQKHLDDLDRALDRAMAERNIVECRFGNMKRRGTLDLVKTKLEETSRTAIHMCVFVQNTLLSLAAA